MHGQWIGTVDGPAGGFVILDLDDLSPGARGSAFLFPHDEQLPGTYADLRIPDDSKKQALQNVPIFAINRASGTLIGSDQELAERYEGVEHSRQAQITFELDETDRMHIQFRTDVSEGSGTLAPSTAIQPSQVPVIADIKTWSNFKQIMLEHPPYKLIYRGQPCPNRLRTSFHRRSRKDLVRYVNEDINMLRRQTAHLNQHQFDLSDPVENGAFYSLIQHHGYPTPLLDWTYSPFVAAFFAFRDANPAAVTHVRIFVFDKQAWEGFSNPLISPRVTFSPPHFSILESPAIANLRLVPQQALSTVTNVDDIEAFLLAAEGEAHVALLRVIELPVSERKQVMEDLSIMGITAGSLLPGMDGTCEALKGRMFGYQ